MLFGKYIINGLFIFYINVNIYKDHLGFLRAFTLKKNVNKNLFNFQTKKYADVIIPRGADNLGEIYPNVVDFTMEERRHKYFDMEMFWIYMHCFENRRVLKVARPHFQS